VKMSVSLVRFQSHNGAIAASSESAGTSKSESGFNPTMVRLLPDKFLKCLRFVLKVSIPQWCDCCEIL